MSKNGNEIYNANETCFVYSILTIKEKTSLGDMNIAETVNEFTLKCWPKFSNYLKMASFPPETTVREREKNSEINQMPTQNCFECISSEY